MRSSVLIRCAVAFSVGIACAEAARGVAALVWWAGAAWAAAVAAEVAPRLRSAPLLVAVLLAGGGLRACERGRTAAPPRLPVGVAADDRIVDELVGGVVGPVQDRPGVRRFSLALAGGAEVEVSARADGGLPSVLPGDRVLVVGRLVTARDYRNPGTPASPDRLTVGARAGDVEVLAAAARPSGWRRATALQRRLGEVIDARGGSRAGRALVRAMAAGDQGGVDDGLADRFRAAGLSHLLAVSGMNLAVTALLVYWLLLRFWAAVPALAGRVDPARAAAVVAAPAAVGYTLMTGGEVATVRALAVALVVLGGAALARRARLADALAVAALAILAWSPSALFEPSFQLSFAATAALAASARPRAVPAEVTGVRRVLARLVGGVHALAAASLWATLATAPITALHFGVVQPGGLVANLVAVPAAELVVLPVGLAGALLALAWPAAGGLLVDVAVVVARGVDAVATWTAAHVPVVHVWPPTALELAAAGGLVVVAHAAARGRMRRRRAALAAAAAVAVLAGSWWWTTRVAPGLRRDVVVTFLDVGQGDAAVIELPGGEAWLVDSGGMPVTEDGRDAAAAARLAEQPGERAVARFFAARRIRRLRLVVLSHPHPDHYAGLRAVARAVPIDELWLAAPTAQQPMPADLHALLIDLMMRGTRVVAPPLGAARREAGVELEALAPRYDGARAAVDPTATVNDNSLVVRLGFAGRHVLFAGDLEAEGEDLLVAAASARADVVKVPHHGSPTSSTARFVAATGAAWAVVSCGTGNRFGFPAPSVVARWRAAGATVLRTDRDGAVTVTITPSGGLRVEAVVN